MRKRKMVALAGVSLLAAGVLAACSGGSSSNGSGASMPSTYSYVYSTDPDTLNYLLANKAATSDITSNLIDGLLENDQYGNLIPSLAEDWKVSKDGLTYTYTLREDAKWFTADGEEYAPVTAQDFITGLKYAADKESEGLYIVQDSIKGLDAYLKGENKDFSSVGIKALDDKTIQYTLKQPEPFWNSKTTMNILFPVNEEFLAAQGDAFGTATDPSTILYNGPYLLSALTAKSSIEFTKNENYWDAGNVFIDTIKFSFFDGSDSDSLFKNFDSGDYTQARVFPNSSLYSTVKEKYGDNIIYSPQASTTYYALFNTDRQNYENTSKTTDEEKAATKAAILNKDFRQAIAFAFDREGYNAQSVGKDAALKGVRTSLVPSAFVTAGGENFGDLVEKELVSYGTEWADVQLDDAQDGLYNVDKAKAEFAKAKKELDAQGVKFPIHLDIPVDQAFEVGVARAQSFKQSIESAFGADNVVVDLQMMDEDAYNNAAYFATSASQLNYDLSLATGWGPDFLDPSTYLDIFNTALEGSHSYVIGIDGGSDSAAAKTIGFETYDKLLDDAAKETTDVVARYQGYAKAQAWLVDASVIIPYSSNGALPSVRKIAPFTGAYSQVGNKGIATYKYLKLQEDIVKTEDYDKAYEAWLKEKAESNAKAEEALADHVE
ncbi:peptide ABC transporter substrate-binding protein [Streptococcus ovuberis]|uniref:Peptide ABC transporter substrate-binding protein n=1 Tax=Streptococcus ovuberis TaxID=1936207 RepID=A0A7X6MZ01_9STRE|nr:peptide ABC transporter substrate-binding protein [Streptococcus ovuberis]NKZ20985.1 peptide ABC transporter substrate-binding protein [Streptococcus ovuberis]